MTEETDRLAQAKACEYEAEFSVRCLVVDNPFAVVRKREAPIYTLFICPCDGEKEDPEFLARAKRCHARVNDFMEWNEPFDFWPVLGMTDWTAWFARFQDKPEEFPLKDMALGANLIGRVIHGQDAMEEIHRQARVFFQDPGIIEKWRREAPLRRARKLKRLAAMMRKLNRLLNTYDRAYLLAFLAHVNELRRANRVSYFVACERSGRPLGKALEWYLDDCPPVLYVDFHHLKHHHDERDLQDAAKVLAEELPELHEALRTHPETVWFVEDMVGYGFTFEALTQFVSYLSGQSGKPNLVCLAAEPPSWWKLQYKHVIGVELREGLTFLTQPAPSRASRRFYERLKRYVLAWKQTPPAP